MTRSMDPRDDLGTDGRTERNEPPAPASTRLLTAALAGLLGTGLGACDDDAGEDDPDQVGTQTGDVAGMESGAATSPAGSTGATATGNAGDLATTGTSGTAGGGTSTTGDGGGSTDTTESTDDGGSEHDDHSGDGTGDDDAGTNGDSDGDMCNKIPEVTKEVPGERRYDELTEECDKLGGYVQVHAACAGVNACAGFSYGDWGESAVVTMHDCAAANGCNGLSCVVLPADSGKSAEEILREEHPPGGPQSCLNCHAEWTDDGVDISKFKLWLPPGSDRNAENWLDLPKEAQARIIAFGKAFYLEDGTALANMAGYHKKYSRAEIERVVDFIRSETQVVVKTYKTGEDD